MSFLRHEEIYQFDGFCPERGTVPGTVPIAIALMSFQWAIPWRVALQQCPPPLRQLRRSLAPETFFRQGP